MGSSDSIRIRIGIPTYASPITWMAASKGGPSACAGQSASITSMMCMRSLRMVDVS
jgi:hypothetical protein